MRIHFYNDIYQIIAAYISFYIMDEMSEKEYSNDGIIVRNMLNQILSTKSEIKQRYDMLVKAIDIFFEKMVGDTTKKIIFPIYFEHNPPFKFREALDMIGRVKSNRIVFFIGTVASKEFFLEALKDIKESNIRIIF